MYDLIIIGAGPAGYNAAEKAAKSGQKVLVFEKNKVGGVCLNEGCVPTKTFLYSAKIYDSAKHGEKYGVYSSDITIKHDEVVKRKDKVVNMLTSGVAALLSSCGVDVVFEEAKIKGRKNNEYIVCAKGKDYFGKRLLIATGSSPLLPPISGLKEALASGFAQTNREILALVSPPKVLAIIGGGVIGLEMASYFSSIGSKVTVIEALDHIAGQTEKEIGGLLQKEITKKGVDFKLSSKVVEITSNAVVFETNDGKKTTLNADLVLLSIGRKPNTQDIGLETIGVEVERGAIKTDEKLKTNIPEVYAAGDVNGKSMLAHTAYREGEVAINTINAKKDAMLYSCVPSVIYTNPEVSSVGETQETAKSKNIDFDVVKVSMRYSGRYVAENQDGAGVFVLLVDKKLKTIIGATAIANYSSEFIVAISMIIQLKMNIQDVRKFVFPHPTVCEILREAVFEYNKI